MPEIRARTAVADRHPRAVVRRRAPAAGPVAARAGGPGVRRALPLGVVLPVVLGLAPPSAADAGPVAAMGAVTAAAGTTASCTTPDVVLGFSLLHAVSNALRGRPSTTAVHLDDPSSGTHCELRADRAYDAASVVKVTVLGALLMTAEAQERGLTAREKTLAKAMITRSDNAATSSLWQSLGTGRIDAFREAAGMTGTVPGRDGYWGLTRTTARDQNTLLRLLTTPNAVLTHASRTYALGLLRDVVPGQRWGTPAGAPAGAEVRLKNGWLPRAHDGWRVHSAGAFTVGGRTYHLTVLTEDNPAMGDGIATIEALSRAVHRELRTAGP
ncbi:serine hydrolase [Streptomyces qinzhouensis]|uniref:Serine hydrolase n=1 Tax=Streptomyces qinzhouensis TaxID=2599401 RepID=A0A5B8JH67_9ACTN|nr:serine hydrolase [Streptomyces qinzhouensis]QDY76843.1 serine hydrolase [Streptomyces qinzhouensis]